MWQHQRPVDQRDPQIYTAGQRLCAEDMPSKQTVRAGLKILVSALARFVPHCARRGPLQMERAWAGQQQEAGLRSRAGLGRERGNIWPSCADIAGPLDKTAVHCTQGGLSCGACAERDDVAPVRRAHGPGSPWLFLLSGTRTDDSSTQPYIEASRAQSCWRSGYLQTQAPCLACAESFESWFSQMPHQAGATLS